MGRNRLFTVSLAIGLAFAAMVPFAQAQAPPLTTEATILYAHTNSDDSDLWMNTLMEDPDADADATVGMGTGPGESATFTERPALDGPVELDPEGTITFHLRFGSGLVATAGTLSTELMIGETVIASASGEIDAWVSEYKETTLTATPDVSLMDPALGDLTWTVSHEGAGTQFLQTGQSGQYSRVVLPVITEPTVPVTGPTIVDLDEDGLDDDWETTYYNSTNATIDPAADLDGDGLNNTQESLYGTDPEHADTDRDKLTDAEELGLHIEDTTDANGTDGAENGTGSGGDDNSTEDANGTTDLPASGVPANGTGTDPLVGDTDGDGAWDGAEFRAGTDPLDAEDTPELADMDGDGMDDAWEEEHFGATNAPYDGDADGDNATNEQEFLAGSDPIQADTDGDGLTDGEEINIHGTDPTLTDTDGDGVGDATEVAQGTDPLSALAEGSDDGQGLDESEDGGALLSSQGALGSMGYLLVSGAALLALILVSILALTGRWKK